MDNPKFYRAPQFKFPCGLNDCYDALLWVRFSLHIPEQFYGSGVRSPARELNID